MLIDCMGNLFRMKKSVKHYSPSPSVASPQAALDGEAARDAAVETELEDFDELPAAALVEAESGADMVPVVLEVDSAAHGERLDKLLARQLSEFSRSRIQQWIDSGAVTMEQFLQAIADLLDYIHML